jgi:flagellar basal body rod protein FlgG
MLTAATARALADIAARASDVLHAYDPSYVPLFGDALTKGAVLGDADPLAVVAPDGDYFIVDDPSGKRRYTRDGAFRFVDGRLRNEEGDVLGFPPHGTVPQALCGDPVDVALGRPLDVRIEADGSVTYTRSVTDPRTMQRVAQRVVIGTLALARFPAGTNPLHSTVNPHLGRPGSPGFGTLTTRARAIGSVDMNLGLAKLQEAYLAFNALQAAEKARRGLDRGAMDLVK